MAVGIVGRECTRFFMETMQKMFWSYLESGLTQVMEFTGCATSSELQSLTEPPIPPLLQRSEDGPSLQ